MILQPWMAYGGGGEDGLENLVVDLASLWEVSGDNLKVHQGLLGKEELLCPIHRTDYLVSFSSEFHFEGK